MSVFSVNEQAHQNTERPTDPDPFCSESNIRELKRRIDAIENGTARLEEHDLIEVE